jgi:hypothetical protein
MSISRYSTSSLANNGANIRVAETSGGLVTKYDNATGAQPIIPTDGIVSFNIPEAISPNRYSFLLSYFMTRGFSKTTAETMILVTLDTAKGLGISPIELIQKNSDKISFTNSEYEIQNNIRTNQLKMGNMTLNDNSNSRVNREIRI